MTGGAGVAETHTAVVFFLGDRAYKVKKPVDLGFLDFRDREVRREVCHREVELNRRLAPRVYFGVADVMGPDGEPVEHLVVMRRMPADRRLATLVAEGEEVSEHLWDLSHLLAAFHARADRGPAADRAAGVDATRERWAANTRELGPFAGRHVDGGAVEKVQRLADRYLDGRAPLLEQRVHDGRACDGHGDLLADDVFCLDEGPQVLDCIEFDDALRLGDALGDVAFLAMDLERLGRPELASEFLAAYREHAGDSWPASLAHHHVAYRAQVRAKVSAIRADQGAEGASAAADQLLRLAREHLEAGRVRCVVVGGLPGTGKSTLAAGVADELEAAVLRSDEIRREIVDGRSHGSEDFRQGRYHPEVTDAVYGEMRRRAGTALAHGESVVLDASFDDAGRRAAARDLAREHHADLSELRCTAPRDVAEDRLRRRAAAGDDASEATPAVAEAMAAEMEPWPEAHPVATDRSVAGVVGDAVELIRRV